MKIESIKALTILVEGHHKLRWWPGPSVGVVEVLDAARSLRLDTTHVAAVLLDRAVDVYGAESPGVKAVDDVIEGWFGDES